MRRSRETDRGLLEKWYLGEARGEEGREWRKITLPGSLSERGLQDFKGVIWLKKRFHLPEEMAGKAARLWLGTLTDSDETYLNGTMGGLVISIRRVSMRCRKAYCGQERMK